MNDTVPEALLQLRQAHHHEIRGALNALRLQLTLLQRGRHKVSPDDPRIGQWVDGAAAEADAVERALEELSAVERIYELPGEQPIRVVERVSQLLEPLAKTHRVHLDYTSAMDDAAVEAETSAAALTAASGMAQALLEAGACRIVDAEPGTTLTFRIGSGGIEISPGSHLLPYDLLSEGPP